MVDVVVGDDEVVADAELLAAVSDDPPCPGVVNVTVRDAVALAGPGGDGVPAEVAEVNVLQQAILCPRHLRRGLLDARGPKARGLPGHVRVGEGEVADGEVADGLLRAALDADEAAAHRRDDLGLRHVLVGKRPIDHSAVLPIEIPHPRLVHPLLHILDRVPLDPERSGGVPEQRLEVERVILHIVLRNTRVGHVPRVVNDKLGIRL